jgi:hypothetical protein
LLVVPAGGAEFFEALDFGFDVVCFEVEVHSLFGQFLVVGALEQDADVAVGESESAVDVAAGLGEWFFGGVEGCGPEVDAAVEVVDVDDEVA